MKTNTRAEAPGDLPVSELAYFESAVRIDTVAIFFRVACSLAARAGCCGLQFSGGCRLMRSRRRSALRRAETLFWRGGGKTPKVSRKPEEDWAWLGVLAGMQGVLGRRAVQSFARVVSSQLHATPGLGMEARARSVNGAAEITAGRLHGIQPRATPHA
jgi:hypothetical protein